VGVVVIGSLLGQGRIPVHLLKGRHSTNELKAIIHNAEEGGYWAEVPALPGCVSEEIPGTKPFSISKKRPKAGSLSPAAREVPE